MNHIKIFDAHLHTYGTFLNKNTGIAEYLDQNHIHRAIITTINKAANPKILTHEESGTKKKKENNPTVEEVFQLLSQGQLDHSDVDTVEENSPDKFIKFFWFNPKTSDENKTHDYRILKKHFQKGYRGVKLHSGIHLAEVPHDIIELVEFMQDYNEQFPLYIHSTPAFSRFKGIQAEDIRKLAEHFPNLKIMVGHAGFAMEYAIELGLKLKKYDNVFFETSCSTPYAILSLIKMTGHHRILFGSDAPIANPVQLEIDKIMSLPISIEQKEDIFYHNTENLLFNG